MSKAAPNAQLAMDETLVDDGPLEVALEGREAARIQASEARKAYRQANDEAVGLIAANLKLTPRKVIRVGRFRIERTEAPSRTVHFRTEPRTRVRITADGEE